MRPSALAISTSAASRPVPSHLQSRPQDGVTGCSYLMDNNPLDPIFSYLVDVCLVVFGWYVVGGRGGRGGS